MLPHCKTYDVRRNKRLTHQTLSKAGVNEIKDANEADWEAKDDNEENSEVENANKDDTEDEDANKGDCEAEDANEEDGEAKDSNAENVSPQSHITSNCIRAYKIISMCKDYILNTFGVDIPSLKAYYMLEEHKKKSGDLACKNVICKVLKGAKRKLHAVEQTPTRSITKRSARKHQTVSTSAGIINETTHPSQ